MKLTRLQWMQLLIGKWELLYTLGMAGTELFGKEVDTMVERWDIISRAGDVLAPELDELIAKYKASKGTGVQAFSTMTTEAELEAQLISGVENYFIAQAAAQQSQLLALKVDGGEQVTVQARRFDGTLLKNAIRFIETIAPLIAVLAPLVK